jgi:hypothetical protein
MLLCSEVFLFTYYFMLRIELLLEQIFDVRFPPLLWFLLYQDSVSGMAAGMPVVGLGTRNPEQLLTEATFVVYGF